MFPNPPTTANELHIQFARNQMRNLSEIREKITNGVPLSMDYLRFQIDQTCSALDGLLNIHRVPQGGGPR